MFGARGLPRQLQKIVGKKSSCRASLLDDRADRAAYVQFPANGVLVDVAQW